MARRRAALAGLAALLASALAAGTATAAFPGVNGVIAVERDGQIVLKQPGDLLGGTPITTLGTNSDPAWSPDGLRIAFISTRGPGGTADVWVMNADGSDQRRLTQESADASAPSWSPDGGRIAYTVTAAGHQDVAVMPFGTSGQRVVIAGGDGDQGLPVWTPDGARVVFDDSTVGGLSIVGATGAGRTAFLSDADQADFSPDGSRLVVRRTDIERLQVVNADGSGGIPVLEGAPGTRPVWSPDGARILYHRFVSSGPPSPNYRLFTVASGGGGAETPESQAPGLSFSPDWQPIGPQPRIGALSGLQSGTPGATLTVDGTGFVRRSVVRWNGTDRPTTFVGLTRLTAVLGPADVASPGTARVTVYTPPSGGGLSPPATATITPPPPPPPRILVGRAAFGRVKWAASRARGTLRVAGTLEAAGRVEVALLRGRRVLQRRVYALPAGPFARRVPLGPRVLPGRLTLRIQGVGPTALIPLTRTVVLPAPPQGVAETAFISALQNGPPARTLRDKARIFATFRFAALPKGSRRITTRWIPPGRGPTAPDGRPRRRTVTSFIASSGRLPTGVWRCELRVGGALVAVARVRLR
ncbi:TolB family protein [Miltoncostaea marina]|uniref:TolB family protein n=1 Tax=Miltoncostaea marina TaxID=2843215 RepID=UPI001C3CC001|nr:hypothetical protein [Miltoncostaea marina]